MQSRAHDADDPAAIRRPPRPLWSIAIAGAVALGGAMGIGRFAFTPLLPMMIADGVIDLASAGWLASANDLGYLAGALHCRLPLVVGALLYLGSTRAFPRR